MNSRLLWWVTLILFVATFFVTGWLAWATLGAGYFLLACYFLQRRREVRAGRVRD